MKKEVEAKSIRNVLARFHRISFTMLKVSYFPMAKKAKFWISGKIIDGICTFWQTKNDTFGGKILCRLLITLPVSAGNNAARLQAIQTGVIHSLVTENLPTIMSMKFFVILQYMRKNYIN